MRAAPRRRCLVALAIAAVSVLQPAFDAPASATASGVTLASGVVRNAAGKAVPGSQVLLVAWPSEADLNGLSPGQSTALTTLDQASTDATGRFTVGVASATALKPFAGSDGLVDLQVISLQGGSAVPTSFSRTVTTDTAGQTSVSYANDASDATDAVGAAALTATAQPPFVTFTGSTVDVSDADAPAGKVSGFAPPAASASGQDVGAAPVSKAMGCNAVFTRDLGKRWSIVGTWSSTTAGVDANFDMEVSSRATFGVAFSTPDAPAVYHAEGTSTKEASAGQSWAVLHDQGNRGFRTQVDYRKYEIVCGVPAVVYYEVRPHHLAGGTNIIYRSNPPQTPHCVPYSAGTTSWRKTSKQTGFSNGVDISAYIKFDLYSQSGWSQQVHLKVRPSRPIRICGTDDDPLGRPGEVVARPR